jgi:ABC-2 type transport system permease protein
MLVRIARFELRYLLRNPLLWATAVGMFGLCVIAMVGGFELSSDGGLLENAAYATVRNYMLVSVLFMFVTTSFVANVVARDDETGFGPIIRSTPITKLEYLIGRFLGAFAISALCMLLVPLGIVAGTIMPWADPTRLGPSGLVEHLYGYFVIALPNLFIHSGLLFALATITRSMMAAYLGAIGFISSFFILSDAFKDRPQLELAVALADPFGGRPLADAVRYWTIAERNTLLPDVIGPLLYNRLLWIGISAVAVALAYKAYRFADQGMSKRERKKLVIPSVSEGSGGRVAQTLPSAHYSNAALRALLWMRTRFEMKQVIVSPAFPVLIVWGLFRTVLSLLTQRGRDGRPTYPTTFTMIPEIADDFYVIPLIVAVFYAGELVWRERDRRVHELVDASPMPNWAYVVPKTAAMALVLMTMMLSAVAAAVIYQLAYGYTDLQLGEYLLWFVLPTTWDMLLVSALAIFVHALSPHKAVGWGVMALFLIWQEANSVIEHSLLNYGDRPWMPLSDFNGAHSFWQGPWTFRIYWGAFATLMLVAAHLLWRRGTEIRLRPRLALARRRVGGATGWLAGAALAVFAGSGAYAYYNTNILNPYLSRDDIDLLMVDFEKKYGKYVGMPQPTIADMKLNIALYPEERRAMSAGSYVLRNDTPHPITDVHVRLLYQNGRITSTELAGGRLIVKDDRFDYRIYRLDAPMRPGEERLLTFATRLSMAGFLSGGPYTSLVENGTFLNHHEFIPIIGMGRFGLMDDYVKRRKYGLPDPPARPKLDDVAATAHPVGGRGWTKADITLSTTASQTPIAPGRKISDVTRGGRRIARFVSGAPIIPVFSMQSARYAEKHRLHNGIDLGVYYHPGHDWNVDRMLDAAAVSLDYYQANFGPYQFDHVRIVEFPGYRYFAQAHAGTIPTSEKLGFISDFKKPETIDHVTLVTAHELAHQYWAHQVVAADTEGSSVLSETLAQYSAMMVMKKLRGEDQLRRHLQYELDRYLDGRANGRDEPTLARVGSEGWLTYHKGSLAMYLLQKRLGEDAINRALRTLIARYRFKGPPYPRSLDLIAALRAEAKTPEEQALITDLFERNVLYDLKVTQPTAVRRPDGKWDVTVPIEAKKFYVDEERNEKDTPFTERIEVGLFTSEPGRDAFNRSHVILMERHPIRDGRQVLKFVSDRKPLYAGVDPYNFYIDRNSVDNVMGVE